MASPWPGLTWKNKLNSLVGPTAMPGREVPVAVVVIVPPRWHPPGCERPGTVHRMALTPPSRARALRPLSVAGERHAHRSARDISSAAGCDLGDVRLHGCGGRSATSAGRSDRDREGHPRGHGRAGALSG